MYKLSIGGSSYLWYNTSNKRGGDFLAIRESQRRAVAKYNAANYERIELRVERGQKEVIKQHASKQGETLNRFVNRAISETTQRDNEKAQKEEE